MNRQDNGLDQSGGDASTNRLGPSLKASRSNGKIDSNDNPPIVAATLLSTQIEGVVSTLGRDNLPDVSAAIIAQPMGGPGENFEQTTTPLGEPEARVMEVHLDEDPNDDYLRQRELSPAAPREATIPPLDHQHVFFDEYSLSAPSLPPSVPQQLSDIEHKAKGRKPPLAKKCVLVLLGSLLIAAIVGLAVGLNQSSGTSTKSRGFSPPSRPPIRSPPSPTMAPTCEQELERVFFTSTVGTPISADGVSVGGSTFALGSLVNPNVVFVANSLGEEHVVEFGFEDAGWGIAYDVELSKDAKTMAIGVLHVFGGALAIFKYRETSSSWEETNWLPVLTEDVSMSYDGTVVAVVEADEIATNPSTLRVYQVLDSDDLELIGEEVLSDTDTFLDTKLTLSGNGTRLCLTEQSAVRCLDVQSSPSAGWIQAGEAMMFEEHLGTMGNLRISEDGTVVAFGSDVVGSSVYVHEWGDDQWTQIGRLDGPPETDALFQFFDMSPDGQRVVVAKSYSGLWSDVAQGQLFQKSQGAYSLVLEFQFQTDIAFQTLRFDDTGDRLFHISSNEVVQYQINGCGRVTSPPFEPEPAPTLVPVASQPPCDPTNDVKWTASLPNHEHVSISQNGTTVVVGSNRPGSCHIDVFEFSGVVGLVPSASLEERCVAMHHCVLSGDGRSIFVVLDFNETQVPKIITNVLVYRQGPEKVWMLETTFGTDMVSEHLRILDLSVSHNGEVLSVVGSIPEGTQSTEFVGIYAIEDEGVVALGRVAQFSLSESTRIELSGNGERLFITEMDEILRIDALVRVVEVDREAQSVRSKSVGFRPLGSQLFANMDGNILAALVPQLTVSVMEWGEDRDDWDDLIFLFGHVGLEKMALSSNGRQMVVIAQHDALGTSRRAATVFVRNEQTYVEQREVLLSTFSDEEPGKIGAVELTNEGDLVVVINDSIQRYPSSKCSS